LVPTLEAEDDVCLVVCMPFFKLFMPHTHLLSQVSGPVPTFLPKSPMHSFFYFYTIVLRLQLNTLGSWRRGRVRVYARMLVRPNVHILTYILKKGAPVALRPPWRPSVRVLKHRRCIFFGRRRRVWLWREGGSRRENGGKLPVRFRAAMGGRWRRWRRRWGQRRRRWRRQRR